MKDFPSKNNCPAEIGQLKQFFVKKLRGIFFKKIVFSRFFGRSVIPAGGIFQKSLKLIIPDILSYIAPGYDFYRPFYDKNKNHNFLILYPKKTCGKTSQFGFFSKKNFIFFSFFFVCFWYLYDLFWLPASFLLNFTTYYNFILITKLKKQIF